MSSKAPATTFAASGRPNARAASFILLIIWGFPRIRSISDTKSPGVRLFCSITTAAPERA